MNKKWTAVLVGVLLTPLCFAKTLENKQFTAWLEKNMQAQHIPGVSIAIVHDYDITETKAFGKKQSGTTDKLTTETPFQVGELTQAITASLALQTAYEGKLRLSAPVNRTLSSWTLDDNGFTRRRAFNTSRILNGSSGTNIEKITSLKVGQAVPTTLQMLNGQKPASNEAFEVIETPGTLYRPTVGSYLVLQQMLEDIHEKSFTTATEEKIFTPLKMTHTSFAQQPKVIAMPHSSKGFVIDGGPRVYPAQAANGLWSTPSDLATWMVEVQKAYNGKTEGFLHPKMAKKLFNANLKHRDPNVPDTSAGMIANVDRFGQKQKGGDYFILTGKTQGYQAMMIGNKVTGDGAVIMLNKGMATKDGTAAELQEILAQVAEFEGWLDQQPKPVYH